MSDNNNNNNNNNNNMNLNNQKNQGINTPPNVNTNKPQKKPSASAIDKKERKQLWQSLAKYCDELIEETQKNGLAPTHRFVHPQAMIDNFIKLGLRPPNNPRGLEKFYDNFITRCNYLSDNNKNKNNNNSKNQPKIWKQKGTLYINIYLSHILRYLSLHLILTQKSKHDKDIKKK